MCHLPLLVPLHPQAQPYTDEPLCYRSTSLRSPPCPPRTATRWHQLMELSSRRSLDGLVLIAPQARMKNVTKVDRQREGGTKLRKDIVQRPAILLPRTRVLYVSHRFPVRKSIMLTDPPVSCTSEPRGLRERRGPPSPRQTSCWSKPQAEHQGVSLQ